MLGNLHVASDGHGEGNGFEKSCDQGAQVIDAPLVGNFAESVNQAAADDGERVNKNSAA